MANTVKVTSLLNGPRNIVLSVFLAADGAEGELVNYTIADPVALGFPFGSRFRINCLEPNLSGFSATLAFDNGTITPNYKVAMAAASNNAMNFNSIGGLPDDSGLSGTGKLFLSTNGFITAGAVGFILVHLLMNNKRGD